MAQLDTLALIAIAAMAGARCTPSRPAGSAGAAPTKITAAIIAIVDVAPIYLGRNQGFFAEQGIDLTLQLAQGGAAIVPGVVSGQYQFGFANLVSLLLAQTKGLPLKLVAAGNSSTGTPGADFGAVVVPAGSPARTARDLEGKTVAIHNLNNIGDLTIRASVRKAGGDPAKVKFLEVAFADVPAALAARRIDAAFVVEPFLTVAREQGARVLVWNLTDAIPNLMVAAYFTTTEYARKHPEVVKRFAAAMNRSLSYAAGHPEEARVVVTGYTKLSQATAGKLTLPRWTPAIDQDSVGALSDLMVASKLAPRKPDLAALLP
jgi:NitT/TauT family transport system substrate-binding protein